jgi:hypothetical protein
MRKEAVRIYTKRHRPPLGSASLAPYVVPCLYTVPSRTPSDGHLVRLWDSNPILSDLTKQLCQLSYRRWCTGAGGHGSTSAPAPVAGFWWADSPPSFRLSLPGNRETFPHCTGAAYAYGY